VSSELGTHKPVKARFCPWLLSLAVVKIQRFDRNGLGDGLPGLGDGPNGEYEVLEQVEKLPYPLAD
jgi:hypothetical protein